MPFGLRVGSTSPGQDDQMEQLVRVLTDQVMGTLQRPAPTAPQPAQQQPLSPMAGLAAVRNPQFAPHLIQQAQAPEQARFAGQQAAFEQAMSERDKALTVGTQLAGQERRLESGARPFGTIRGVSLRGQQAASLGVPDGTLAVQEFVRNPDGSFNPGRILAFGQEANRILEMQGGFGAINPYTLGVQPGGTLGGQPGGAQPKPASTDVGTRESIKVISDQLSEFKRRATEYTARERTLGSARATTQQFVRGLGETGQSLSEQYGDPEFEVLASLRARIGKQLARMVENNRLSDQDLIFAMQQLPTVASLNTPEGRVQFVTKIDDVERELRVRLRNKALLQPELFSPEERQLLVSEPSRAAEDPAVTRARQLIEERRRQRGRP